MRSRRESAAEYCRSKGWAGKSTKDGRGQQLILDCPLCGKQAVKGERPFYINVSGGEHDGQWQTWCCHETGNLWTLREKLGDPVADIVTPDRGDSAQDRIRRQRGSIVSEKKPDGMPSMDWIAQRHADLFACEPALHWLTVHRGITREAAGMFHLGYLRNAAQKGPDGKWLRGPDEKVLREHEGWPIGRWLVIPFIQDGEVRNVKLRNFDDGCAKKDKWRRKPGGDSTLFGVDLLADSDVSKIHVCEAELDTISAWQMGLRPVVGSSLGAGSFPDPWKAKLARYDDVYLLYDQWDDESRTGVGAGDEGAAKAAGCLGMFRCHRVVFPAHDVNDWMRQNPSQESVTDAIGSAISYDDTQIESVYEYGLKLDRMRIVKGVESGWRELDDLLGGVRDGEVTIITGDTSIGKTTFATDWLRRQAEAGHAGLYWPIEGGMPGVTTKWWSQRLQAEWRSVKQADRDRFRGMLESMKDVPMYLFPGLPKTTDDMLAVLKYFARRFGGRRLVVDHFHAHIRKLLKTAGDDRFLSEQWLDFWCAAAKATAMHIALVAHPRNPQDDTESFTPGLSHFKGTSAGKQDPDVFLVLARKRTKDRDSEEEKSDLVPTKVIAKKVRSDDGHEGHCVLTFHKPSQRYLGERELRELIDTRSGQKPIDFKSAAAGDSDGWFDDPE